MRCARSSRTSGVYPIAIVDVTSRRPVSQRRAVYDTYLIAPDGAGEAFLDGDGAGSRNRDRPAGALRRCMTAAARFL